MKKYLMIALSGLGLLSCSDYLEITPPNNIIQEQIDELLVNGTDADRAKVFAGLVGGLPRTFAPNNTIGDATGRYANIVGLESMRNLEGNDVVMGTNAPSSWLSAEYECQGLYQNDDNSNSGYWNTGWGPINSANKMLMIITDEMVKASRLIGTYRAVGYVVRSHWYNWLMEQYQDAYLNGGKDKLGLMWYDKWNPSQEPKPRETAVETYNRISSDIKWAVDTLEANNIKTTDNTEDVDLLVAAFVQARIALVSGNYSTAIAACDKIINSEDSHLKLMDESTYVCDIVDLDTDSTKLYTSTNPFLNNAINPEVILGWKFSVATKTGYSYRNIFNPYDGSKMWRIDPRLYDKIDDNDYRKLNFQGGTSYGNFLFFSGNPSDGSTSTIPSYVNFKFAATCKDASDENSRTQWTAEATDCYMRLSEVYLMKAEAQEANGDAPGAKTTLNKLLAARTHAGATTLTCDNYAGGAYASNLKGLIQLQWRIEMWGERGIEFYNNKRWNIPVDRNNSIHPSVTKEYPVRYMTLEIPESEQLYNPNLNMD